ncbi:MAG TPA: hypothetical protein VN958_22025 [Chitinophagaceae bacterium]|nr:hypothetical protein [Chitinophagaceae bacterium]
MAILCYCSSKYIILCQGAGITTNTILPGRKQQSKYQPFVADDAKQKKSNHVKKHTGGQPSQQKEKTQDQSFNRNMSIDNAKE